MSGHADNGAPYAFASRLDRRRLRKVFLVHGENDAGTEFRAFLMKRGFPPAEIMKYGERYTLAD